jgi:hypothetical protein
MSREERTALRRYYDEHLFEDPWDLNPATGEPWVLGWEKEGRLDRDWYVTDEQARAINKAACCLSWPIFLLFGVPGLVLLWLGLGGIIDAVTP